MQQKVSSRSAAMRTVRTTALALTMAPAVLSLSAISAYAQVSATVNGTVTDPTGAVISGAKVTLINQATQEHRDSVANGEGYFAFPALLPGTYTVHIDAKGFQAYEQKGCRHQRRRRQEAA